MSQELFLYGGERLESKRTPPPASPSLPTPNNPHPSPPESKVEKKRDIGQMSQEEEEEKRGRLTW